MARRARRPAATPVSRHAEVPSLAAFGIAGCGGRLPRTCQERSVMGFPLPMSEPLAAPVGVATEHTGPAQRSPRPPQRSPSGAPEGSSTGDQYRGQGCPSLHVEGQTLTVVCGADHVLLGRVNGVVSIVNFSERELVASISLSDRRVRFGPFEDDLWNRHYGLTPGKRPLGICGTPTVSNGIAFVGTSSGEVVAIEMGL